MRKAITEFLTAIIKNQLQKEIYNATPKFLFYEVAPDAKKIDFLFEHKMFSIPVANDKFVIDKNVYLIITISHFPNGAHVYMQRLGILPTTSPENN